MDLFCGFQWYFFQFTSVKVFFTHFWPRLDTFWAILEPPPCTHNGTRGVHVNVAPQVHHLRGVGGKNRAFLHIFFILLIFSFWKCNFCACLDPLPEAPGVQKGPIWALTPIFINLLRNQPKNGAWLMNLLGFHDFWPLEVDFSTKKVLVRQF